MASCSSAPLTWCLGLGLLAAAALAPDAHQVAEAGFDQVSIAATPRSAPHVAPVAAPSAPINCTSACEFRCSKAGRPNICLRACGTCCSRCHCVPPGTSGNQEKCGTCYTSQKTHDGVAKCP